MKAFLKAVIGFFATLLVICIVLIVGLNSFLSNNLSKREIIKLVDKYSEIILDDIEENSFEDTLKIKGVTKVTAQDVTDVQCGGKGFASATSYYGFYYYENDEPVVMFNGHISNVEKSEFIPEDNGYTYTEKNSDNTYYTERISPCFYYYEWHF